MIKYCICIFIINFALIPVYGINYYVSTIGNDGNTGTFSSPFSTVQHALNIGQGGDTVFLRAGTYFEKVVWTNSGQAAQRLVLKNFVNEVAIINGQGNAELSILLINSKSHIHIEGIIFENNYLQDAKGIYLVGQALDVIFSKCKVRNIGWTTDENADPFIADPDGQAHGILINGRTVEGIHDISINECRVSNIISGNSEAVTLVGNVYNFDIYKDTVHNTKNIGIVAGGYYTWAVDAGVPMSLNQSRNGIIHHCVTYANKRFSNLYAPAGIYCDGCRDITISHNISYQNGNGFSVGCENTSGTVSNVKVFNNCSFDNDNMGIYFGANGSSSIIKQCTLKNNTFFTNGSIGNFYSEISLQQSDSCLIIQNIIIPRSSSHYGVSVFGYALNNLKVDNNLVFRYNNDTNFLYVPGTPPLFVPTNTLVQNPLFIDSTLPDVDLHLQVASPAIDKGFANYGLLSMTDLSNTFRLVNGKLDHGAYESQIGNCPSVMTISPSSILSGKWIAQDKIIMDVNNTPIIQKLVLHAPLVEVINNTIIKNVLHTHTPGCTP